MFENLKITGHLVAPIATIDYIFLDSLILSSILKEKLGDEYYKGSNQYLSEKDTDIYLGNILEKRKGTFCSSIGFGDNMESISSWVKRFDTQNDDIIKAPDKGKNRIDIGSGSMKNYHMPIVTKSYKTIYFYARGNKEKIEQYLNNINFIGKKRSQGYGEILYWEIKTIKDDWSLVKDGEPMRPLPMKEYEELSSTSYREYSRIPPYWRNDCKEICVMPNV